MSVSSNITTRLKNAWDFLEEKDISLELRKKISKKDFTDKDLKNRTKIVFEKENTFSWSLKKQGYIDINFPNNSNTTIKIIYWWPLYFKFWSGWVYTSSWIIEKRKKIIGTSSSTLTLKNLWWIARFHISSSSDFKVPEKRWQIIQKIWNKSVERSFWSLVE